MTLERYGFRSGDIIFPGIEMPAELTRGFYFRDYGIVPDIREGVIQMMDEMKIKDPLSVLLRREEDRKLAGRHIGMIKGGDVGSAIFLRAGLDIENKSFIYGHESVHALINLGLKEQFVEFLNREGFNINPFNLYSDEEKIADFGGVLALYKHGLFSASHPSIDKMKEILMASRK